MSNKLFRIFGLLNYLNVTCSRIYGLPYKTYDELHTESTTIEITEFISKTQDHCAPTIST